MKLLTEPVPYKVGWATQPTLLNIQPGEIIMAEADTTQEIRDRVAQQYLQKLLEDTNLEDPDSDHDEVKEHAEKVADTVWIYTNEFMRSRIAQYAPNTLTKGEQELKDL